MHARKRNLDKCINHVFTKKFKKKSFMYEYVADCIDYSNKSHT